MSRLRFSPKERAELYAKKNRMTIEKQIGGGFDGVVLGTSQRTAIKSLNSYGLYRNERDVYLHLQKKQVNNVHGFEIPRLIAFDDDLFVIEMTLVSPPFLLDFAGASLVGRTRFEPEIWEEWQTEKKEQFETEWPRVKTMLYALEGLGVYMNDVHPGNVMCEQPPK